VSGGGVWESHLLPRLFKGLRDHLVSRCHFFATMRRVNQGFHGRPKVLPVHSHVAAPPMREK